MVVGKMILTYVGNKVNLTNKDLLELKKLPYLNGISISEINVELKRKRIDWNKKQKETISRIKAL